MRRFCPAAVNSMNKNPCEWRSNTVNQWHLENPNSVSFSMTANCVKICETTANSVKENSVKEQNNSVTQSVSMNHDENLWSMHAPCETSKTHESLQISMDHAKSAWTTLIHADGQQITDRRMPRWSGHGAVVCRWIRVLNQKRDDA